MQKEDEADVPTALSLPLSGPSLPVQQMLEVVQMEASV
jgi:hypothetical protein